MLDHPAHELNTEAYRRLSPFQQLPALEDDGVVLSESAAILVYLARKSGKLMPTDLAGEAQVTRWCFAAMNSLELPLLSLTMIDWVEPAGGCAKYRAFVRGWAELRLPQLDRWIKGRDWVATESFTVADILVAHVLAVVQDQALLAPHDRGRTYRDRCFARPSWKRVIERYEARVEAD